MQPKGTIAATDMRDHESMRSWSASSQPSASCRGASPTSFELWRGKMQPQRKGGIQMSKMSNLDLCISELRNAAQSLNAIAESLSSLLSNNAEESKPVPPTQKPNPVTLEQVRAVLADKSRDGYTAEVRALLEKHGAAKLSEIDPDRFAALLADAEGLGNG